MSIIQIVIFLGIFLIGLAIVDVVFFSGSIGIAGFFGWLLGIIPRA